MSFYEVFEGETVADALERMRRVRVLKLIPVEDRYDQKMCWTCSCKAYQKYGQCKHALALSVTMCGVILKAEFVSLAVIPRPGRPRLAVVGGLTRQDGPAAQGGARYQGGGVP